MDTWMIWENTKVQPAVHKKGTTPFDVRHGKVGNPSVCYIACQIPPFSKHDGGIYSAKL